jgi:hypothetical protein
MYSSFSSTSNGCDSCSSLDEAFGPSNGMGAMSSTSNINQMLQQATQNGVMNQHANTVGMMGQPAQQPQVVYVQQPAPQVASNNRPAVPNVATVGGNNAQPMAAKQAMSNMVAKAVGGQVVPASNTEGFQGQQLELGIPGSMMFMNLGFVVLAALAFNEAFKYYINKAIQSAEGPTHYYLMYAVVAVLLVIGAHFYTKRQLA